MAYLLKPLHTVDGNATPVIPAATRSLTSARSASAETPMIGVSPAAPGKARVRLVAAKGRPQPIADQCCASV
jgi:hypothetical protein